MEAVCSSETLVSTCKSTRRHNPEDRQRQVWMRFKFYGSDRWYTNVVSYACEYRDCAKQQCQCDMLEIRY
jgi:hypothetical protein